MFKLLTIALLAVLATGCASNPQRAAQRAEQKYQEALALANETEYQCVQRSWREIDSQYAFSGVLPALSGNEETLHRNLIEKQQAKKDASYLCSLKKKV